MNGPSILEKLESGVIDFETAYSFIQERWTGRQSEGAADEHRSTVNSLVMRNQSGQVVLERLEKMFLQRMSAPSKQKIHLVDVARVEFEEIMPKTIVPGDGIEPSEVESSESLRRALRKSSAPEEVVQLSYPQPEVALITLQDEKNRNMFSPELARGVTNAFEEVAQSSHVKTVVVTGYGNWFCSGGTPDSLEAIRQGGMSFLDDTFFKSLLDCPLPTVAAIQGHALGGGLTFGLYADLIVMAEHAYYAANFMDHGFTPGVGATLLFPKRFGEVLGNEMMLTARRYQGRELRERGAPMEIVGKEMVHSRALELATLLANKPILQLRQLKAHLAQSIASDLPEYFKKEQAMHDTVFAEYRADDEEDSK